MIADELPTTSKSNRRQIGSLPVSRVKIKVTADATNIQEEWYVKELLEDPKVVEEYSIAKLDGKNIQFLSLYHFPENLLGSLKRIQAKVESTCPPGLGTILACCLSWGAKQINANEYITQLKDVSDAFELIPEDTPGGIESSIRKYMDSVEIPIDLPKGTRKNFRIPKEVWNKSDLGTIASKTGTKSLTLAIIAVMIAIVEQPEPMVDHKKFFRTIIDDFFQNIEIKSRLSAAMMREFKLLD